MSVKIWEQQRGEKDIFRFIVSANLMASLAGKAMAFTPALTARMSVLVL